MSRKIALILSLFLIPVFIWGQGLNNNYPFDDNDLKNIFEMQGINTFKFPFNLNQGEYISLSYSIYEDGIEKEKHNPIEDLQIEAEITFNQHISRQDAVVFHRLYFMNQGDSIINFRAVFPGISMNKKIDISRVKTGSFTANLNIDSNLPVKKDILYYYGLFSESEKYVQSGSWLECATGLSSEELIKTYDFAVIFYVERITKERAKTILKEEYYKSQTVQ